MFDSGCSGVTWIAVALALLVICRGRDGCGGNGQIGGSGCGGCGGCR